MVIYVGPGYFPFYWSYVKNGGVVENETAVSGVVSTDAQYQWTLLQDRPPRSKFFRTAHRYVLQPDHFCGWGGSWIGKLNVKFFTLFNLYGSIYLMVYITWGIRIIVKMAMEKKFFISFYIIILFVSASFYFIFMTSFFCFNTIRNSLMNITRIEKWNKIPIDAFTKNDWRLNLSDFYGDDSLCCYLCPSKPFGNKTNDELAEGFPGYDEIEML